MTASFLGSRLSSPRLSLFGLALLASVVLAPPTLGCTTSETTGNEPKAEPKPSPAEVHEPAEVLPEAADLLAQAVLAAGGEDKIEQFETIHHEGKLDTGKQKLVGTSSYWWRKDGAFYLEQNMEGIGQTTMGYDGTTLWTDDPIKGLRKLEGLEAASHLQSAMMFPARDWQDHFSAAKTLGKTQSDGNEVWEIELTSAQGTPSTILALDVETKLVHSIATTQISSMGDMPFTAYAEKYELVEGYKFAMVERASLMGLMDIREDITSFEVNVPIDESLFTYPDDREVVPTDPTKQPAIQAPAPAEAPAPAG